MLKKATALEVIELDRGFARRVTSVAAEGRRLTESYADLSARMLDFAVQFRDLWLEAKRLDKAESGQHQLYLRKKLSEAVQSDDPSVWSKWNTIGSQAKTLLRYKTALPPQRECLYALAIAANEEKPIKKWIDAKALTYESTVREVSALCKSKRRKLRQKQYLATVTLAFQNYEEAADVLRAILISKADFKLRSHRALGEALKPKLDTQQYASVQERFL
jgi:hypothetical protein